MFLENLPLPLNRVILWILNSLRTIKFLFSVSCVFKHITPFLHWETSWYRQKNPFPWWFLPLWGGGGVWSKWSKNKTQWIIQACNFCFFIHKTLSSEMWLSYLHIFCIPEFCHFLSKYAFTFICIYYYYLF